MTTTQRLMLVDGNNLLIRAMYAGRSNHTAMSNDKGVGTTGLVIFVNMLSKFVRRVSPDRMCVCWDGGKSVYRTALFDGYKAARNNTGAIHDIEDGSFDLAKRFLTLSNIHHLIRPGVEADDLIAALWRRQRHRIYIVSGDKDFLQLADGWTEVITPDDLDPWTSNRIRSVYLAKPADLPKVMALTGDNVDNVPGVPGIGVKKAVGLLSRYDWDLDRLLDAHEKALIGWEDKIRRNLALVDLRTGGPDLQLAEPPLFKPTIGTGVMGPDLLAFLDRYQLASIRRKLLDGTLWKAQSTDTPV